MTRSPGPPMRIAIAGASSLLGREITVLLSSSSLPAHELRLLDDAQLDGTLTEAGGEPGVIRGLKPDSFDGVGLVFFAGLREFATRHWADAQRAGAAVVDLSGAMAGVRNAAVSIPSLDARLGSLRPPDPTLFRCPGAAAIVAATLSVGLRDFPVRRLAATFLHPVSELGQAGIDELESQATSLLSFQPFAREVFDAQAAFNLLERFGESSPIRLEDLRELVTRDVSDFLGYRAPMPAVEVVQAPVFYGAAFSVFAEFEGSFPKQALEESLRQVGVVTGPDSPSNATAAGSAEIAVTLRNDGNLPMSWWIWGAVDNVRLAAQNAVRIAEHVAQATRER
ncbi:MAG TPA: Asd/ArgC dimerization domain-containing protein [Candidatus Binatia bacterium]|nr:Asd/ArgC dimerization domain-containing protein [Candidatus Binatia bacterium]